MVFQHPLTETNPLLTRVVMRLLGNSQEHDAVNVTPCVLAHTADTMSETLTEPFTMLL